MEFMNIQMLPGAEQQAVGFGGQFGITEPHQPTDPETAPGQDARHGPDRAVGIFQRLPQIQKTAALGRGG